MGMMVRDAADLESHIVAVERIEEYTEIDKEVNYNCIPYFLCEDMYSLYGV